MRRILRLIVCVVLLTGVPVCSVFAETDEELNLNARAAVLMDADSGRVLYGKDEETAYPMASTTKIMTLIIALEEGKEDSVVTASAYAASMPEVRLGVREGEQYRMGDLYYALMLESFNDAAVMIAEGVAGSVENFAGMMNEKASALGCTNTYFITPNGLDASDGKGVHSSTARDMALIMRYAIGNQDFLKITQTRSYSFSDTDGRRSFSLTNKNALFDIMEGAISGKTGYTGDAGYCYVCAVQMEDKCMIASLLGSGWPPHKNYKWQDVKTLMTYGDENYDYQTVRICDYTQSSLLHVVNGCFGSVRLEPCDTECRILMREGEKLQAAVVLPGQLTAPVKEGETVGEIFLYLNGYSVGKGSYRVSQTIEEENTLSFFNRLIQ
ncbi:MAG: D-alanyl-D-alanine carboxypeptidase family protein [Coprococcus sp.]